MLNKIRLYGFYGTLRVFISLVYTKLFFRNAKLIRLPFDIRNRSHIIIGDNFTTGFGCRLESYSEVINKTSIRIGKNVQINDNVHITAINSIELGDNVLIASKVFITDHNHGSYGYDNHESPLIPPANRKLFSKEVKICDDVWLGEFVCVLPGVEIGKGSVIGSMSVVTKNIPPYSIAVGSPAKVIKKYDFDNKIWVKVNK